jgi:polyhydroxyalkanoate synthase
MGGLLALPLALARQDAVAGLMLLATPWDFHAERGAFARAAAEALTPWWSSVDRLGELPIDALQTMFAALDPFLVLRKFRGFAALDPASAQAREFVALEDWLNDGVALAGPVAAECLGGWYGENLPGRGAWALDGRLVDPRALARPALVVVPAQDRIVPPASALALARAIPRAETMQPALGHIGMVASSRAPATLWPALGAWLGRLAESPGPRL